MELSILLVQQIAVLFAIAALGYFVVKKNLLKEEDSKVLSWLAAYVLSPCVTIRALEIDYTPDKLRGLLLSLIVAVIVYVLYIAGARLFVIPLRFDRVEQASVVYSNCGYLIIPLVSFVLGQEWVFYTCAYIMVGNTLMWTHLYSMLSGKSIRDNIGKIMKNPNIISIVIGFFLFFTGIRIPAVVAKSMDGFGNSIGPVTMFVVGMLIGNKDLKEIFRVKKAYLISLLRLVVFPAFTAVFLAGIVHMGIHPDAQQILLVTLLAACAPVAVMVTQLALLNDQDAEYASMINMMSVFMCIITMPLMTLFYTFLCGL